MTKEHLQQHLLERGIANEAYSLNGGHPPEAYVLAQEGSEWRVYYSERGVESGATSFLTESAACEYLLTLIVQDRTTHS